jgi:hypothetical protein
LRIALAAGCWAMALLATRGAGATASWLWLAGLGIAAAIFAPGVSPYFIFPAALAALLFLLTVGFGRTLALFLAALAMLVVWIGFSASGEAIMGLAAHPLFTAPVGIGLIALLPLMAAQKMGEGFRRGSVFLSLLVALVATAVAGFEPAYSATQPERLNLRYLEKDGNSWWLADPVPHLPASLRAAVDFSPEPEFVEIAQGYSAPAGGRELPLPTAGVSRIGKKVMLDVYGSGKADSMAVIVPDGLGAITVGGVRFAAPVGRVMINCGISDCARVELALEFSGPVPGKVLLVEQRRGLPGKANVLLRARPDWAVPSQGGDVSATVEDVMLPGGF